MLFSCGVLNGRELGCFVWLWFKRDGLKSEGLFMPKSLPCVFVSVIRLPNVANLN